MPNAHQTYEDQRELILDLLDHSIWHGTYVPIPTSLMLRIGALTAGVEVDLNAPIEGDVDL